MTVEDLFDRPQYELSFEDKARLLLPELNALTRLHRAKCAPYDHMLDIRGIAAGDAGSIDSVPWLPVGLFKSHWLSSVPPDQVFRTLTSSGTSGDVSRIPLDTKTAELQSTALVEIMSHVIGRKRLPMVIVDAKATIRGTSARAAGILGMMSFGRKHFYALDDQMNLDTEGLTTFLRTYAGEPILIFGFTFMVWRYFFERLDESGVDLSNATLIHSGGWKKLEEESISNEDFKRRLRERTGITQIYNFYGMVEQVGSVFLEGEDGNLYSPNFAEVIVRDPETWEEMPPGRPGVLQVLSVLPRSYPGHSILTEDLGVVVGIDDSTIGRSGKYFKVIGRAPKAELRGCSDTHAFAAEEALRAS